METNKTVALAAPLVMRWEGFRERAYLCPDGYPTIGYGTRMGKLDVPPVTEPEAREMLERELRHSVTGVLQLCGHLRAEPEYRTAALASFVYNLGIGRFKASTLREYVERGMWDDAADEFSKWVWGGGRKLPGLVLRRAAEARLFKGAVDG